MDKVKQDLQIAKAESFTFYKVFNFPNVSAVDWAASAVSIFLKINLLILERHAH